MSHVAAQYAALANRLSTYLQKYLREIHTEVGTLVDSGVRTPIRELRESDAAGDGRVRRAQRGEDGAGRNGVAVSDREIDPRVLTPLIPEGQRPIFPDRQKVAQIVHGAHTQSGNFDIGRAGRTEADAAGLAWVGLDARRLPYGETYRLVSKDGLRQYRPPQQKPSGRGVEANYERRSDTHRHWEANAHLVIEERR